MWNEIDYTDLKTSICRKRTPRHEEDNGIEFLEIVSFSQKTRQKKLDQIEIDGEIS